MIIKSISKVKKKKYNLQLPPFNKIKKNKKINDSFLYCLFTKQNSIFTLTNFKHEPKLIFSTGICGFNNSKSKTKYATQLTAEMIAKKARSLGYKKCILVFRGKNKGRIKIIRFIKKGGLQIKKKILEFTPISHNGCRPQKKPRL